MRLSSTVHFIGISGIGMSALARILLQRGYRVTGSSDRATPLTARLSTEGATIAIGHEAKNVGAARTVIVSSAIGAQNPELLAARKRDLEIVHRGALLAHLMEGRRGIAIAGTHGKTTTTAMVASVLEAGGLDPTVVVGGERIDTNGNARDGNGAWFVAESDESDGSFLDLRPEIAVVTNVENDHVTSDAEFRRLIGSFERFLNCVTPHGLALVGVDEPRGAALAGKAREARTRTFGFTANGDLRVLDAKYVDFGSRATLALGQETLGVLELAVPGAINVRNALAAVAIGLELGLSFETIGTSLAAFHGVHRRFELLAETRRMSIVDDYAHHPTAVAATLAAARAGYDGPIVAVFQPHRYTRTAYLAADFAHALRDADRVVLTDVYSASEPPIEGATSAAIGEPLRALGTEVAYVGDVGALPAYLLANAPEGALVVFLGAGSITSAAAETARELRSAVLS